MREAVDRALEAVCTWMVRLEGFLAPALLVLSAFCLFVGLLLMNWMG